MQKEWENFKKINIKSLCLFLHPPTYCIYVLSELIHSHSHTLCFFIMIASYFKSSDSPGDILRERILLYVFTFIYLALHYWH